MKFTLTHNVNYRHGVGSVPAPWIETSHTDHEKAVLEYFHKHIRLLDFDSGDEETYDFVFEDGKAFRLEYHYWWHHEYDEEHDEDMSTSDYNISVRKISIDEADVPSKTLRDWI